MPPQAGGLGPGGDLHAVLAGQGGQIAGDDDVPLEGGGGVEDELVLLQSHGHRVVKPGVDGGGGHLPLQQGQYFFPDIFRYTQWELPFIFKNQNDKPGLPTGKHCGKK